jgi:hypothetical protein
MRFTTRVQLAVLSSLSLVLAPVVASAQLVVDAGEDVTLECESDGAAEYTLNGSISPESPDLTFSWSSDPAVDLDDDDTLTPTGSFAVGDTVVTLDAEDVVAGTSGSDDVTVTVEDSQAPVLRARANPFVLWPPNHEMRRVTVDLRARDRCGDEEDLQVELVSAESNEPDNGRGDGNTTNDIQDAQIGEDDRSVLLRAERSGGGDGRVYTLTYRATDGAGNQTEVEVLVHVPHDFARVKELLMDDMGGDPDDMEPICVEPDEAADEFVNAVPAVGSFPNGKVCSRACRVWSRGCNGIVNGTARCVQSEVKSVARLEIANCTKIENRRERKQCKARAKREAAAKMGNLAEELRAGLGTCESVSRRCANACRDIFDENGSDYDDEGVGEE